MSRNKTYTISKRTAVDSVQRTSAISKVMWHTSCAGSVSPPIIIGCPLTIYNVMGQEDDLREDPVGTRVQNFLTARIVVTTTVDAEITIDYSADTTLLDLTTGVVNPGSPEMYHEVFITGLQPDTLYAFRVTATSSVCDPGENGPIQSGIYYFRTGDQAGVSASNFTFSINTSFGAFDVTITDSYDGLSVVFVDDVETLFTDSLGYSESTTEETIDKSLSQSETDTELFTSISTSVV